MAIHGILFTLGFYVYSFGSRCYYSKVKYWLNTGIDVLRIEVI